MAKKTPNFDDARTSSPANSTHCSKMTSHHRPECTGNCGWNYYDFTLEKELVLALSRLIVVDLDTVSQAFKCQLHYLVYQDQQPFDISLLTDRMSCTFGHDPDSLN